MVEKTDVTKRVAEIVKDDLNKRDGLKTAVANLMSDSARRQKTIDDESSKRVQLDAERVKLVEAALDTTAIDEQIVESHRIGNACARAILSNNELITERKQKVSQANTRLKLVTLRAIERIRPDTLVNKMFKDAMDAVDAWTDVFYKVLDELEVRPHINAVYDGEWRLPLEPHLTNENVRRLNKFVPEIEQPEQSDNQASSSSVRPEPLQTEPGAVTGMTAAEAQENARLDGRKKSTIPRRQTVAEY